MTTHDQFLAHTLALRARVFAAARGTEVVTHLGRVRHFVLNLFPGLTRAPVHHPFGFGRFTFIYRLELSSV